MKFDLERFVEECCAAVRQEPGHRAVAEVVDRALRDPSAVAYALGEPMQSGLVPI